MENPHTKPKLYKPIPLDIEEIGRKALDAAYTVHSALGPGLWNQSTRLVWLMKLKNLD